MFKKILLPLDFTAKNQSALQCALTMARQNRASVTLLHVIETIEYADDDTEIVQFYETLKRRARINLAARAERFEEAGISVSEKIVIGKRAHAIVSYALQSKHDLIVMSSHKVKLDDEPRGWATLSYQVCILSQCPVLLVK